MDEKQIKIPEPIVAKCNEAIAQLQELKEEITTRKENIREQDAQFECRLNKVTANNNSIRVNSTQKSALQQDCMRYQNALDGLLTDIEREIENYNVLTGPDSASKLKTTEDLFILALYIKRQVNGTKKFIKKVKKDVAIAHSRFSFGFDAQQKQLNYVEWTSEKR